MNSYGFLAFVVLVTLTGMLLMLTAIRKIPEGHRGVLFRAGKLVKELQPGTAWVLPLLDSVMLVNLSEQTIALPADLSVSTNDKTYTVEGSFTCKIIQPVPAVMAALQARKDLAVVVADHLLAELKRLGVPAALDRPEQAEQWALDALNAQMSRAWQVKFIRVEFRLISA